LWVEACLDDLEPLGLIVLEKGSWHARAVGPQDPLSWAVSTLLLAIIFGLSDNGRGFFDIVLATNLTVLNGTAPHLLPQASVPFCFGKLVWRFQRDKVYDDTPLLEVLGKGCHPLLAEINNNTLRISSPRGPHSNEDLQANTAGRDARGGAHVANNLKVGPLTNGVEEEVGHPCGIVGVKGVDLHGDVELVNAWKP
jgi:hypothetical protein